jgi:osmotically-inducible protein OsmY
MSRDPSSYDEIVRRTIPEPDGGQQPSKSEQDVARHRAGLAADHVPHALSRAESATLTAAQRALAADSAIDMSHVRVAIDGRELILKGQVPGPSTKARIEDIVMKIDGVDRVDNQLAVLV